MPKLCTVLRSGRERAGLWFPPFTVWGDSSSPAVRLLRVGLRRHSYDLPTQPHLALLRATTENLREKESFLRPISLRNRKQVLRQLHNEEKPEFQKLLWKSKSQSNLPNLGLLTTGEEPATEGSVGLLFLPVAPDLQVGFGMCGAHRSLPLGEVSLAPRETRESGGQPHLACAHQGCL